MIGKIVTFKIDLLLKTHWTNFELEIEHPSPSMSNVHKLYEMYACTCTSTCTKLNCDKLRVCVLVFSMIHVLKDTDTYNLIVC